MKEEEMKIMNNDESESVKEEMKVMNNDEVEVIKDDEMKTKRNVAAGVSSGLGATVGAAAGTIWAEPVYANIGHDGKQDNQVDHHQNNHSNHNNNNHSGQHHDNHPDDHHDNHPDNHHDNHPDGHHDNHPDGHHDNQPDGHHDNQPDEQHDNQPVQQQVEVISYETRINSEGHLEDVAVVSENGHYVKYVDENQDGWADVKIDDANGNGIYEEDEFHKLTDQLINMEEFGKRSDLAELDGGLADLDPDYTNDANIDEYMA